MKDPEKTLYKIPGPQTEILQEKGLNLNDFAKSTTAAAKDFAYMLVKKNIFEKFAEKGYPVCLAVKNESYISTIETEEYLDLVKRIKETEDLPVSPGGTVLCTQALIYTLEVALPYFTKADHVAKIKRYLNFLKNVEKEGELEEEPSIVDLLEKVTSMVRELYASNTLLVTRFKKCRDERDAAIKERDELVSKSPGAVADSFVMRAMKTMQAMQEKMDALSEEVRASKQTAPTERDSEKDEESLFVAGVGEEDLSEEDLHNPNMWKTIEDWMIIYPDRLNPKDADAKLVGKQVSSFFKRHGMAHLLGSTTHHRWGRCNTYHEHGIIRYINSGGSSNVPKDYGREPCLNLN